MQMVKDRPWQVNAMLRVRETGFIRHLQGCFGTRIEARLFLCGLVKMGYFGEVKSVAGR